MNMSKDLEGFGIGLHFDKATYVVHVKVYVVPTLIIGTQVSIRVTDMAGIVVIVGLVASTTVLIELYRTFTWAH